MTNKKEKALEIGDCQNGMVVFDVDLEKNTALWAPKSLFVRNSDFDHQDDVVKQANDQSLHGQKDWRRSTDKEASALVKAWDKVAPPELQGDAAPLFWGKTKKGYCGRVYRSGETRWQDDYREDSHPVLVVRSSPARPR
jgi:hypothetical protein